MIDEIYKEVQLIDLHGYTTGIQKKTSNQCIFYFNDYKYGPLVLIAERDCVLYYEAVKGKVYHLQVSLKGLDINKPNKKRKTRNALVIKKVIA